MYIDKSKLPHYLRHDDAGLAAIVNHLTRGIREYFCMSPYGKAVIGLSGGIDSAVSFALAVKALGPDNVIAVRMPFRKNNDLSMMIAEEIAKKFGLPGTNLLTVDITKVVEASWSSLEAVFPPANEQERRIRLGNNAARERMKVLMDLASHYRGLVLGTENRTEEVMAYFTIGGDSVSNLEPIQGYWKVEVFQIGEYLGLPDSVLNRAPSAELWDNQTDEDELGSYITADIILAGTFDHGINKDEIDSYGVTSEAYKKVMDHVSKMYGKSHAPGHIKRL